MPTDGLLSEPDLELLAALPTPLSHALDRLHEIGRSESSLATLWLLRDSVECSLRLLVAGGIAELLAQAGSDDAAIGAVVRQYLAALLVDKSQSLGRWVQLVRELGRHPEAASLVFLPRLKEVVKSGEWRDLFDREGDDYVHFRNQTLGHGTYTPELEYLPRLKKFYDLFMAFCGVSHRLLWSTTVIQGGGIVWRGLDPSDPSPRGAAGWFAVELRLNDGPTYGMDPLMRGNRRHDDDRADLLLFDSLRRRKKEQNTIAFFLDYLRLRHRPENPFFHLIEEYVKYVSGREGMSTEAAKSEEPHPVMEGLRNVRYLEERLASWANVALADPQRGAYARVVAPVGAGKSWFARSLIGLQVEPHLPFTRTSLIHSGRCRRLLYSVADHAGSDDIFWESIAAQAERRQLLTQGARKVAPQRNLGVWIDALVQDNRELQEHGLLLIVVDGLDELPERSDLKIRLTKWLTPLPPRCAVVLTSRPELRPAVEQDLIELESREPAGVYRLAIDPQSPENLDLQRLHLEDPPGRQLSELEIEEILRLSEGTFLYAHQFALALARGAGSPGGGLPEPSALCAGLLEHLRRRVGERTFQDMHNRLLLAVLAAKEPISLSALEAHWGLRLDDRVFSATKDLSFIVQAIRDEREESCYRPAHALAAGFLREEPQVRQGIRVAHRAYADAALRDAYPDGGAGMWAEPDETDSSAVYAILHLGYHLRKGGDRHRARTLEQDPERRRALRIFAVTFAKAGRYARSRECWEALIRSFRSERRSRRNGDAAADLEYAAALVDYAETLKETSLAAQAEAHALEAVGIIGEYGEPRALGRALDIAAHSALLRDRYLSAMGLYERALETRRAAGAPPAEIASSELGRAEVLYFLDRTSEALETCERIAADEELTQEFSLTLDLAHLYGRVLIELERYPEALVVLERGLAIARAQGSKPMEADMLSFVSDAYLASPDGTLKALEALRLAYAIYTRHSDQIGCAEVAWGIGDVNKRMGNNEEAGRWYLESVRHADNSTFPGTQADARLYAGEFFLMRDDPHAIELLQEGRDLAKSVDYRKTLGRLEELLGRCEEIKVASPG